MQFSKKEEYLREKDKKLKKIIDLNGHIAFQPNKKNHFDTLVGIVISQFISTKAANSIFKKIRENFNSEYLNEKHFQNLKINEIKMLGLSVNKAKTIKEISNLFLDKKIEDLSMLNDQELNQKLLSIFGVGPWSVNMFEIFCLGKLDIFSSKDAVSSFKNMEGDRKNNYFNYSLGRRSFITWGKTICYGSKTRQNT